LDDEFKSIPVGILTSSREDRDLAESYRLGVNAYVVKPVNFHDFVEAVSRLGVFWLLVNETPPDGATVRVQTE
jgi:DNA-binding NarL/FixJ family response regulator